MTRKPHLRSFIRQWPDDDLEGLIAVLRDDHFVTRIYGPQLRYTMLATALAERARRTVEAQDHEPLFDLPAA